MATAAWRAFELILNRLRSQILLFTLAMAILVMIAGMLRLDNNIVAALVSFAWLGGILWLLGERRKPSGNSATKE